MPNFSLLGQARLDGAFCDYTEEDKINYLKWLNDNEVDTLKNFFFVTSGATK